jgi:hypothetical protein
MHHSSTLHNNYGQKGECCVHIGMGIWNSEGSECELARVAKPRRDRGRAPIIIMILSLAVGQVWEWREDTELVDWVAGS